MIAKTRKPSLARVLALLGGALWLAACHSPAPDPAPPPAKFELASAPPGARGARAAGTDAAPPRPNAGVLGEPGTGADDEAEPEADGGADGDAGVAPDAAGGVAL